MIFGYARVSTTDRQSTDLQLDALKAAGCEKIFQDQISGAKDDRPGLKELLKSLAPGDQIVVYKLDRLGRSVPHLLCLFEDFKKREIHFRSLTEVIDSKTPSGQFLLTVLVALSAMEREILIERTKAGIEAARQRGRVGGRPPKITAEQKQIAKQLLQDPSNSVASICRSLGIAKSTFYRSIKGESH